MAKIATGTNVFINPMAVALIGVREKRKANFMTVGWITRVNASPPMLAVAINRSHYTAELVREHKEFSVNIPGRDMAEKVDYCGLVSGKDTDKSAMFKVFNGSLKGAPMIAECPLNMECRLLDTLPLPTNYLFIGEIVAAYTEEKYLTDKLPDVQKIDSISLTMPDCFYRALGEPVGKAWSNGKRLVDKQQRKKS